MRARNGAGVQVERDFYNDGDEWKVEHVTFQLPAGYHQGGHGQRMMRASVEAYDRVGVQRIELEAAGQSGGYAWAKAGFVSDDARSVRALALRVASRLPPDQFEAVRTAVLRSSPDDLLFDLARVSTASAPKLGRDLLIGSNWHGHIDLTNTGHRRRLASYFAEPR